ncbi:transcriptional regulator [Edaphobacillus lindanitolerans]|uniref:CopG family transcriptional regulator / antitoxin EndoAI n=1 Tax=Edaphobacillus lindanitolerans TaxID=550447 RepID=A0A1U7PMA7_9BACI|nr:transcriptional regulator [Edaphobacillus lindanitolerans]SIT89629.1 CopG family transcriptional regulator / antitoxin EndoAI [Edaphobacillus lindanitolerans]
MKNRENHEEIIVRIPEQMLRGISEAAGSMRADSDGYVYLSTTSRTEDDQTNLIREAMMKGYVEMSHINLSIATECLYAEYEAEHTLERLVSGG